MAWFMSFWEGGPTPSFEWEDKSGLYGDKHTPLPFSKWTASPKVDDISNIPTVAIQTDEAPLTDVFWVGDAGVISRRFKQIIEDFEPGVHQFFPVTLKRMDGSQYDEEYFIFHPTSYAPCVLLSKCGIRSKVTVKHGPYIGLPHFHPHEDEYVISRPAYGDRKIFDSIFVMNDGLLVADDLMARIKAEDIQFLRVYPVKEIDEPWLFEKEAPELAAFLKDHPDIKSRYKLEAF